MSTGYTSDSTGSSEVNWVSTSTSEVVSSKSALVEGEDYYWEEVGNSKYRVFTAKYLYNRGFCCNNSCRHCPYNKKNKK